MNLSTIQAAIYNWASANVDGATVFWNEPAGPRPPLPGVRLKLIGGPAMHGMDELRDVHGDPNNFTIVGDRMLTLSVTAFGPAAQQIVSDLQSSLSDPASQATLAAGGVTSLSTTAPRDVSTLLDTQYEQRCNFDVELLAAENLTVQPGVIQHVTAVGTITDETGATVQTITDAE